MAQGAWVTKILLILVSMDLVVIAMKCGDNMNTYGYTEPAGDITLEVGLPLKITCVLEDKSIIGSVKKPSTRMFFKQENIEPPESRILNDHSIQLYIPSMKITPLAWFSCNYKNENNSIIHICSNAVLVGTKPQEVTDLSCISYNLENLTCTFTPPNNVIKTEYKLSYRVAGRSSLYNTGECPNFAQNGPIVNGVQQWMCVWKPDSQPHYRQVVPSYIFTLMMNNTLGSRVSEFPFDHFKYVKAGPPEDLKAISSTTNSMLLSFMLPNTMRTFKSGLEARLFYQCLRGPKVWQEELERKRNVGNLSSCFNVGHNFSSMIDIDLICWTLISDVPVIVKRVNIKNITNSSMSYNLTGLENAGVLCDIRVSLKLKKALETMWSTNSSITYSTAKTIPGAPPKVNIGSFQIDPNNKVYIYWQQIPEGLQNGGNFTYAARAVGLDRDEPRLVELTDSYAKFENVALIKENKFAVWSRNEIGDSIDKSFITIPSQSNRPRSVDSFKKLARKNGTYQVHIQRGNYSDVNMNYMEPKNYTIFWCNNHQDRPYQCQGYLNWTEVSINTTNFTVDLPNSKNYIWQFAISVNTDEYSSGMVWAVCTVLEGQPLGVIKQLKIVSYGAYGSIRLGWQLECSDSIPTIEGYIIYYCPLAEPKTSYCKESLSNTTVLGNSETKEGMVTGLKPYTTYRFSVAIMNKSGDIGGDSDTVLGTTLEQAPTPPVNLTILEESITSTSATVTWLTPEAPNGVLKYYEVHYNNKTKRVDNISYPQLLLTDLDGYINYTLFVQACTTACSKNSDVIIFQTKIGSPKKLNRPSIQQPNDSQILVYWEPPDPPRGRIDYYQVEITDQIQIYNTTETIYPINCGKDETNEFHLHVRAVNINENKEHLVGPWSDKVDCYCPNRQKIFLYGIIVGVLLLGIVVFYGLRRTYRQFNVMKNVELKLPPGLAPIPDWGNPKGQEEPEHTPPADEELLLEKMGENRIPSGDSSGCCSGHESVVSESSTTPSNTSDSGTEQNELRKRAKNPGPLKLKDYITMPTAENVNKAWTPSPANYCKFGVDPNMQVDPTSVYLPPLPQPSAKLSYVSSDTTTPPSPYVTTGDLNKPHNSGYVPITYGETPEKPSYVIAGTRNNLIPDSSKKQEENKPTYLQASDATKNVSDVNPWQQQMDTTVPKGYVTVGEPLPTKRVAESKKGYVPHSRHFDTKLLKED